jgi:prepilin-type N-terminal cleavage/methylation domain-containing protein
VSTERGYTILEILVVLLIASLVVTMGTAFGVPWINRERARSATFQIQTQLQLARIQAVSRNRATLFLLDVATPRVQIVDLNDPLTGIDDILLYDLVLSKRLAFTHPQGTDPVTLEPVYGPYFQATFAANGTVFEGAGAIVLHGGDRYDRLTLHGAGGTRVDHWDGAAWVPGA